MSAEMLTCSLCGGEFDSNAEGGVAGDMGIIPVAFCVWCHAGMYDLYDQSRSDGLRECPECGHCEEQTDEEAQIPVSMMALKLLKCCRNALADLEGVMPEFEPEGDRTHSGWTTIEELKSALAKVSESKSGLEPVADS